MSAAELLPHIIFAVLKSHAQLWELFCRGGSALIGNGIVGSAYVVKIQDLLVRKLRIDRLDNFFPFVGGRRCGKRPEIAYDIQTFAHAYIDGLHTAHRQTSHCPVLPVCFHIIIIFAGLPIGCIVALDIRDQVVSQLFPELIK